MASSVLGYVLFANSLGESRIVHCYRHWSYSYTCPGYLSQVSFRFTVDHGVDSYDHIAGIYKIWYYKRKTRRLRRKAGLPELYDIDDLPDPVYDPNYVHVLSEKEQNDLHKRQCCLFSNYPTVLLL